MLAQDRRLLGLFAKAGRSMPSSSPTSSAATRASSGRLSPVLPVPRRRGWWSTPASTHKRWSREQAIDYMVADDRLRPPARPARGRALLHSDRARPAATRSATSPGPARAPRRRRRSARGSTSSEFHEVLKEGAMPLTILEAADRRADHGALRGLTRQAFRHLGDFEPAHARRRPSARDGWRSRSVSAANRLGSRAIEVGVVQRRPRPRRSPLRAARSRPAAGRGRAGPCRMSFLFPGAGRGPGAPSGADLRSALGPGLRRGTRQAVT